MNPEETALHLSRIDSSKGTWLIAVYSGADSQSGEWVLLNLVLEQSIDEEHFTARELGLTVLASELYSPDRLPSLLRRIRHWLETTEGNGFLDLTGHEPPF